MLKSINRLFGNQNKRRPGRTITFRAAEALEHRLQLSATTVLVDAEAPASEPASTEANAADTDSYFEQIGDSDGTHTYPTDDGAEYELQPIESPEPAEQVAFNQFPESTTERGLFEEPQVTTSLAQVVRTDLLRPNDPLAPLEADSTPAIFDSAPVEVSEDDQQVSANTEIEVETQTIDTPAEQNQAVETPMATAEPADANAEEAASTSLELPELDTIQTRFDDEAAAEPVMDEPETATIDQFFASEESQAIAIDNRLAAASLSMIATGRLWGSRKRHNTLKAINANQRFLVPSRSAR